MNNEQSLFNRFSRFLLKIENHKKLTRTKLAINPITGITFLSFLPFILGFYNFLNQKYSGEQKVIFFEKNLPTIRIPTEKIHWDTFQYILKDQLDFENNISKINWSDKDLIVELSVNSQIIDSLDTNLISSLKQISFDEKISTSYKLKSKIIPVNHYYNLDEIPFKLNGIYSKNNANVIIKLSNESIDNLGISQTKIKCLRLINAKLNKKFLIGVNSKYKNIQHTPIHSLPNLNTKKQSFFEIEKIFDNEIRKLFITTRLLPSFILPQHHNIEILPLEKFIPTHIYKNREFAVLQDTIRQIDKILLPQSIHRNRSMSGYKYPDMAINEVNSLILQQKNFTKKIFQIILPPSFLINKISNISDYQPPHFLINSKKLLLNDYNDPNNHLYDGPSILFQEKTGFDWQLIFNDSNKKETLRDWINYYVNNNNPLTDSLSKFFGIFESPESNSISTNLILNNFKNYWLDNLSLFRNGVITNTTPSYFSFDRTFYIPFISNKEWQNIFSTITDKTSLQLTVASIPILEARIPKSNIPNLLFGYNSSIDFTFANPLDIFIKNRKTSKNKNYLKTPLEANFIPITWNYLDQEGLQQNLSSGIYQKIPSFLGKNSIINFYDLWEPLTFKSWLITSQIGFAFLVFNILRALADNYGRELLVYLLDLVALLGFLDDDLKQEIEILMGQREKGFRIISKTTKNFTNVAGIEKLLPEIIEIVWFLRNSGREFSLSKTLPRGVLLSGPPGTGKTLLVQAIAGEAEVPVLALSGSSLLEPGESGALKLEILFQEARRLAPCIVFIDEMDTLAEKREQVLQNPMGADEILESLSQYQKGNSKDFLTHLDELPDKLFVQQDMHKEKLRILMQFLVELDGIQGRDGVIVIGATNRPEMLDAAILRPGRFDRLLELGLPGPEKRKEILKLYSTNLGINEKISWNYLIHRTAGYSAADLASIMNQSSLNAIIKQTTHTIETIEYGIDRITTIGFEKPFKTKNEQFSTTQLAYYQAGKILLSVLLEYHPPTLVTHLWPRRTNIRALQINQNLQKYFFRFARRIELEHRVIGCYAGKASEILFLQNPPSMTNVSDLGVEDIQFAQNLIKSMVQHWYFYSKTTALIENSTILKNSNIKEYRNNSEQIPFFNSFNDNLEFSRTESLNKNSFENNRNTENSIEQQAQRYFSNANWQHQVSDEFEISTRTFSDWYRLYLPDPQQTERNLEWTPPDEFYHGNNLLEELTSSLNWDDLDLIHVDYQIHSLILQSFNKALNLLDQNRELLDKLVYELIHKEILRQPEINKILKDFNVSLVINQSNQEFEKIAPNTVINNAWGPNSRRNKSRSMHKELLNNKKI